MSHGASAFIESSPFRTAKIIELAAAAGPKIAVTMGTIALCNSAFLSEMTCSLTSLTVGSQPILPMTLLKVVNHAHGSFSPKVALSAAS
jgi:hypothetical protein